MRKRINAEPKSEFSGKSKYSKNEIEAYIDSLVEHTLWDNILGEKDVPTLRSKFNDVRTYRNDVMHAHNIGSELFGKANYLFDKINKELEASICKLIGTSEGNPTELKSEVNTAISSALLAMDLSTVSDALKGTSLSSAILEMSSQMQKALQGLAPLDASTAWAEAIKGIQFQKIQSAAENLSQLMNKLSEAMCPYQQKADDLQLSNAFQERSYSVIDGLPRNPTLSDKPDDADEEKSETDHEKQKEGNPNE